MRDSELVLDCKDCTGRRVVLLRETWEYKILPDHDEMAEGLFVVEQTIRTPDVINHDRGYDERETFYKRNVFGGEFAATYCKVVVAFERHGPFRRVGKVISAFSSVTITRGERKKWPKR